MNLNRVVLTGNLTRDPELKSTGSGLAVCDLRVATNVRRKNTQTGDWEEAPNYFSVSVFGAQGENCAKFLSRGRPVAIDGRLRWREWQDSETGKKREAVDIVADNVQFLGGRDDNGGGGNGFSQRTDVPVDTGDFRPQPAAASPSAGSEDDIPF